MQEHTTNQETKNRRTAGIHIAETTRGASSADALRDVHMSLVRAEQNLYNLVQANPAANGTLAPAGFGYGAPPAFTSGFAPGFAPGFGPTPLQAPAVHAPTGLAFGPAANWGPTASWPQAPVAAPAWTPLAQGLSPIVAPGYTSAFPAGAFSPAAIPTSANRIPACDIIDEGKQFVCQLDLPGLRADQVDLLCSEHAVVVSAFREAEEVVGGLVQSERRSSTQQRTIALPQEILPGGVKASLNNGVLTVVLPKANPTEGPRRVKVQG
jgi:HSP20 family molecular chaperone IbpA